MEYGPLITLIFVMTIIVPKEATDSSLKSNKKFTFAVIANPQAFYLRSGGNANDEEVNGPEWRKINRNLVKALPSDIPFSIINGDLTETGWKESYFAISELYLHNKDLKIPFYIGLGNRDYQDNVGNCKYPFWKGKDGCAMESMSHLENQIYEYLAIDKVVNYTDLPTRINFKSPLGSFSYSWDYESVHFDQLQNYPTYKVKLMDGDFLRYTIIPSLTWLADDLRIARHRNVTDIILNFHQYEAFQENSNDDDQRQFRAIMETYKPIAVFSGSDIGFIRHPHNNHSFYYNTTAYCTGPAFDGKFHLVTYNDGLLTVEEWDSITGSAIKLQTHEERRQPLTPICKVPDRTGFEDDVYATKFIPTGLEWNLVPVLQPENAVEVKDFGDLSIRPWNKNDSDQAWGFEKVNGDVEPEYSSWYRIKHRATNYVLESNSHGRVSLNSPSEDRSVRAAKQCHFQQWRPIKISKTEILILNRGGNLLLSVDDSGLHANPGYEISNKAKIWQMKHYIHQYTLNNTRYFKAKENDSWTNPFPEGDSSDSHWQYLSSHDNGLASPCIGW